MRKYRNVKTVVDGTTFDSKREAARWQELQLLERAGHIHGLARQVSYELAPSVKFAGSARAKPALRMIVDFGYHEIHRTSGGMSQSRFVLEDAKGVETTAFKIKRHLLLAIHGLQVRLTA